MNNFSWGFFVALGLTVVIACGKTVGLDHKTHGAWVSSGGELFKDGNNPWFLRNTPIVTYCIQVDEGSISASTAKIETLVPKAIAQWTNELVKFKDVVPKAGVGSQQFVRTPCDEGTQLVFKFGYGTLAPSQVDYFYKLKQYVSSAVRTDYDEVQLRGRGFVYVASDRGPHRYEGRDDLVDDPWSRDGLLYRVLVHELGHVFGIPHVGEGLMSAQYPEYILGRTVYEQHAKLEDLGNFFGLSEDYHTCDLLPGITEWFKFPSGWKCLHIHLVTTRKETDTVIFSMSETLDKPRLPLGVGRINIDQEKAMKGGVVRFSMSRAGNIYLPRGQKVFDENDALSLRFVAGPVFVALDLALTLKFADGEERPIFIKLKPNYYEIFGIRDSQIQSLVFYQKRCLDAAGVMSLCLEP